MKDGLYIQKILKQLKLPQTGIYGYITQLIKHLVPMIKKFLWQKKHLENQTGTSGSFKPVRITKKSIKKKYETWK